MSEETFDSAGEQSNRTIPGSGMLEGKHSWSSEASTRSSAGRFWQSVESKMIQGFSPGYFASVMGTGMSANLLYAFPFPAQWLKVCGIIMGLVSVTIFAVLCSLFITALFRCRDLWFRIHTDNKLGPYMGCFVMGCTTLVSFLHAVLGSRGIITVWVLWWIVVACSFYTSFVTFFMSTMGKHRSSENRMHHSALSLEYLLPVVTLTVASSVGGLIASDLPSVRLKIISAVVCLLMWSIAMVVASIILTVNFWRIFVHRIPSTGQVFTMFLPIGFVGQGAYAILLFGENCVTMIVEHSATVATSSYTSFLDEAAGENHLDSDQLAGMLIVAITMTTAFFAFISMAFGYFLTFCAFTSLLSKMAPFAVKTNSTCCYQTSSSSFFKRCFVGFVKFQRGFWSMTFPIGTMALANTHMYSIFNGLVAFRYVGAIYACLCIGVTMGCLVAVAYRLIQMISNAVRHQQECACPV